MADEIPFRPAQGKQKEEVTPTPERRVDAWLAGGRATLPVLPSQHGRDARATQAPMSPDL